MSVGLRGVGELARPSGGAGTHATVFGLDVRANVEVPFLAGSHAQPTGRTLELVVDAEAAEAHVPPDAELVCDQRERDGSASFRIEYDPAAGYRLHGPRYGTHVLSADGTRARCLPSGCPPSAWQRFLVAQVLPFAALLRGLEVLHASALVINDAAIALSGPSGSGKTSAALELCRRGALFLADDVLALQRDGQTLLGHPGTAVAGVHHAEAARLDRAALAGDRPMLAINTRERLVRMRVAGQPHPLHALFLLERSTDLRGRPRFHGAVDPRLLLGSSFNSVIVDPARLGELLEVCALLAGKRVETVLIGPEIDATQLAEAIEKRLSEAP